MYMAVFGLCVSSSWGNGPATFWRGVVRALVQRGHTITFYQKDVPCYASTCDGWEPSRGVRLRIDEDIKQERDDMERELKARMALPLRQSCLKQTLV